MRTLIESARVRKPVTRQSLFSTSESWRESHSCRVTTPGVDFMTSAYEEYLASPAWKAKREQRLAMSDRKCAACGSPHQIQVHHLTYARIFHEDMGDLLPLCDYHHAAVEELIKDKKLSRVGEPLFLATETIRLVLTYGKKPCKGEIPTVPEGQTIRLTKKLIRHAGRAKTGFNRKQLEIVGVPWPPPRGWLKRLAGTTITREAYDKFVSLRRMD